jgi:hypothetical protein
MTDGVRCWCQHCGQELEPNHIGKCPNCQKEGKRCEATASFAIGIKAVSSGERTRVSYRWNNIEVSELVGNCVIDVSVGFICLIIGLLIDSDGWKGAVVGFVVGILIGAVINFTLRRKIKEIVREITKF